MLFELWDKEPGEYDLEAELCEKWRRDVVPLTRCGLPWDLQENDMWLHLDL